MQTLEKINYIKEGMFMQDMILNNGNEETFINTSEVLEVEDGFITVGSYAGHRNAPLALGEFVINTDTMQLYEWNIKEDNTNKH